MSADKSLSRAQDDVFSKGKFLWVTHAYSPEYRVTDFAQWHVNLDL